MIALYNMEMCDLYVFIRPNPCKYLACIYLVSCIKLKIPRAKALCLLTDYGCVRPEYDSAVDNFELFRYFFLIWDNYCVTHNVQLVVNEEFSAFK